MAGSPRLGCAHHRRRRCRQQGMTRALTLAVTPLNDIGVWARGDGLQIVLFILGAILLARLVRWLSALITERIDASAPETDELVRSEAAKHRHALTQVLTWTLLVLLYMATAILVVQRFGAQRIVQDLLAGFFLIAERQYGFGDLVRISVGGSATPVVGTVEDVSLRITTVRSANGEVIITPNGQTVQVTNLSRDWARAVIDVPVPVTVDVNQVSEILREVGEDAFKDEELHQSLLDPPSVMGVESIEVDQFKIRIVARTLPGKQFEVGRALRVRIAQAFLRAGITVQPAVDTAQPTGAV